MYTTYQHLWLTLERLRDHKVIDGALLCWSYTSVVAFSKLPLLGVIAFALAAHVGLHIRKLSQARKQPLPSRLWPAALA